MPSYPKEFLKNGDAGMMQSKVNSGEKDLVPNQPRLITAFQAGMVAPQEV